MEPNHYDRKKKIMDLYEIKDPKEISLYAKIPAPSKTDPTPNKSDSLDGLLDHLNTLDDGEGR